MTDARSRAAETGPKVAWIASAYGFGPDLAYYRQVFAEFVRRFPRSVIHVARDYPVHLYPELPLRPDFEFRVSDRNRMIGDGVAYTGRLRLPTPKTIGQILSEPSDVLVVIEFTPTALVGWLSAKLRRKRVMLLIESDPRFRGAPHNRFVIAAKSWVARHSNAVLTSNEHGRRYVVDVLRVPEDKVVIGPYLTSDPGLGEDGRTFSTWPLHLLFLNTISRRKGVVELVEALAGLPDHLADRWRLSIVGSGDLEERVRALVAEAGLDDRVSFHGRVPHSATPEHFAAADVILCPTLGDYRSLAGIEAVNAGKGVLVSTKDGASDEIMQHAAAAWLVDPTDHAAFVDVLTEILSDEVLVRDKLVAARRPPSAFSVGAVGDSLQRAVERATA